ncbi:putative inorganic diphosphatase [Medicago truncatula]|nr:putative inorganic diphosphatase [Medicago truncatula]
MTRYSLSVHEIQGKKDDKIFAVCADDPEYMNYNDIKELLPHRLVEIRRFFKIISFRKFQNAVVWSILWFFRITTNSLKYMDFSFSAVYIRYLCFSLIKGTRQEEGEGICSIYTIPMRQSSIPCK